jgi:hypothetical protein
MFDWLRQNCADERKPGETEEQFLYKTRKKTFGPFKRELWELPEENRARYGEAMEKKLEFLFDQLGVRSTRSLVERTVLPVLVHRPVPDGAQQVLGGQPAEAR